MRRPKRRADKAGRWRRNTVAARKRSSGPEASLALPAFPGLTASQSQERPKDPLQPFMKQEDSVLSGSALLSQEPLKGPRLWVIEQESPTTTQSFPSAKAFCPNCGGTHTLDVNYGLPRCPQAPFYCGDCNTQGHQTQFCGDFHRIKATGMAEHLDQYGNLFGRVFGGVPFHAVSSCYSDQSAASSGGNPSRSAVNQYGVIALPNSAFVEIPSPLLQSLGDFWGRDVIPKNYVAGKVFAHLGRSAMESMLSSAVSAAQSPSRTPVTQPPKAPRAMMSNIAAPDLQLPMVEVFCKECNRAFLTMGSLSEHMNTKHHRKLGATDPISTSTIINFWCRCGSGFAAPNEFGEHVRTCSEMAGTVSPQLPICSACGEPRNDDQPHNCSAAEMRCPICLSYSTSKGPLVEECECFDFGCHCFGRGHSAAMCLEFHIQVVKSSIAAKSLSQDAKSFDRTASSLRSDADVLEPSNPVPTTNSEPAPDASARVVETCCAECGYLSGSKQPHHSDCSQFPCRSCKAVGMPGAEHTSAQCPYIGISGKRKRQTADQLQGFSPTDQTETSTRPVVERVREDTFSTVALGQSPSLPTGNN